jgi:hypothetical protein
MRPEFSDWSRRGPGEDVLGAVVSVGLFLVQSEQLVVGLSHLIAYPTGCTLEIRETRLGDDSLDNFDQMVFSARFGEVTARLYDKTAPHWTPAGQPALMLTESASERAGRPGRSDGIRKLWLSPLPPPEPGTLSVGFPDLGPDLCSCPLDGAAIVAAGGRAKAYWRP